MVPPRAPSFNVLLNVSGAGKADPSLERAAVRLPLTPALRALISA
jgi:hypothetical protein